MTALGARWLTDWADWPIVRKVLDLLLRERCRRHLTRLDQLPSGPAQLRALQGLRRAARNTRFARDHDFARLRTPDDYRRLVPLRSPAELRRLYGPPTSPTDSGRARHAVLALLVAQIRLLGCETDPGWIWRDLLSQLPGTGDGVSPLRFGLDVLTYGGCVLAATDPRYSGLRLLLGQDAYFEFVRPGPRPQRLGITEVRAGIAYELALTLPGGIWAETSGWFVSFESLSPPIVRVLPAPATLPAPAVRSDEPALPVPPPHRSGVGSPAAPPETFGHIPWSAPVDRG